MSKILSTTPPGRAKMVFTPSRLRHSMKISAPVSFIPALLSDSVIINGRRHPNTMVIREDTITTDLQNFLKNQWERCEILASCPCQVKHLGRCWLHSTQHPSIATDWGWNSLFHAAILLCRN